MDETKERQQYTVNQWVTHIKTAVGVDKLTVDGLQSMVEDAERRRYDHLANAEQEFQGDMVKLFHLGVEAGLIKEGETWPWQMGDKE